MHLKLTLVRKAVTTLIVGLKGSLWSNEGGIVAICSSLLNHHLIQLFRERLSEKLSHVHATIPKGNMGYDQYTVPDTVAVEPTFVAFL